MGQACNDRATSSGKLAIMGGSNGGLLMGAMITQHPNDPRVDPMQSRKMTARLQAANAADTPILLRTENDAGHGAANIDQAIAHSVDRFSFLLSQLSVEVRAPKQAER